MDYRHTEDFARQMEAAALRGHALRRQAVDAFWRAVFARVGRAFRVLQHRRAGAGRVGKTDATALLEIRVTEGTNSAEEKEAFVEAAFEALSQQLGPLHEASYVVVQEVPAGDWGYGGRTQAQRKAGSLSRARPTEVASAA